MQASTHRRDFQAFGFGELPLADIGRQKKLTFERQREGYVKQVDRARAEALAVSGGKLDGTGDRRIQIQRHFQKSAAGDETFQTGQGGIALARDVAALSGGSELLTSVEIGRLCS